jgi:hypothetical protein
MKDATKHGFEDPGEQRERLRRREVMRYLLGAGAFLSAGGVEIAAAHRIPAREGYGTDPDLNKVYEPGEVWPLTMSAAEKGATRALADVLLPEDELGPAASAVRVPDFIDEWVSAPYPAQQGVRPVILEGLAWLDAEAARRFGKQFSELEPSQQHAICDEVCDLERAAAEFKTAAHFFRAFRSLAMGAYYSTPEGWKAIGYEGNVALTSFAGPPPEVLEKLGLEQTVS